MKTMEFRPSPRTHVGSRTLAAALAFFALIAALIGFDAAGDYRAGTRALHLFTEIVVMALAIVGVIVLLRQLIHAERRAQRLTTDLEAARREAARFREEAREALRGLGDAIDRQFGRWNLTPAEREVALLLLKGLTHREIAEARRTTETTIRQQALAVYRKSGLRSRAELSAFFLEDLLLPVAHR
jgi:DNA-binding CsgD family transcriptional regulator